MHGFVLVKDPQRHFPCGLQAQQEDSLAAVGCISVCYAVISSQIYTAGIDSPVAT